MRAKIVVLGSLNMDLIGRAPRIPLPGETILGSGFATAAGGKGANQATAAARLGAQVTMIGCVGADAYGDALRAGLQGDGIDTQFLRTVGDAHTGTALIVVDDAGENSIVVISGANWRIAEEDVDRAAAAVRGADALVLQLETPLPVVAYAAELAAGHGIPVLLNPAPARPLPGSLLATVTCLIPNESEAALLAGCAVDDAAGLETAVQRLRERARGTIIVTMGSRGAFTADGGGSFHTPAFAVDAVDSTAAGDAFVAGVAVAMGEKRPLRETVRFAAAAGALATTQHGAQPSLPTRAAVEALLERRR